LLQEVLTEQLKEQKEIDRKLQTMSKRLDHLDRAFREEETPLIEKAQEERISEERILHEQVFLLVGSAMMIWHGLKYLLAVWVLFQTGEPLRPASMI